MIGITRILVFGVICVICALPTMLITVDMVGSPVVIMIGCIGIPAALASYLLVGGIYDKIINFIGSKIKTS